GFQPSPPPPAPRNPHPATAISWGPRVCGGGPGWGGSQPPGGGVIRRELPIGLVSLVGLALFFWPFFGHDLPPDAPAWSVAVAMAAGLLLVEAGTRRLDSRLA